MFNVPELVLILTIAVVVFGPAKLPALGKALGKGLYEFRNALTPEPVQKQLVQLEPTVTKKSEDL